MPYLSGDFTRGSFFLKIIRLLLFLWITATDTSAISRFSGTKEMYSSDLFHQANSVVHLHKL